ncbi:MAG: hypothetical protein Q8T03_03640 [Bacteroidota bacterium]|nr:hypothetical protein [Bacteroidota bacterium]
MKNIYTTLFVFFILGRSFSQLNADARKELKLADLAYDKSDFLNSYNLYSKLLKLDSNNYELYFKTGASLFNMNKMDTSSLKYFERSKSQIPESHFYLGKNYQLTGQSKRALEEFYYFKSINTEEKIENSEVNSWIKMSESAIQAETQKSNYIIKNLGSEINSSYPEYVPLVWNMNGSLIFTSRRSNSKGGLKDPYGRFYEDIYMAKKGVETWSNPLSIGDEINTQSHDACVSLSPSGNELIIYRTDEKQTGGDLYLSTYDGVKWSVPVKMGPEINSEFLETSACFSADGNEIVFSSNRPGGLGGKDLYRIRKFMNGKFSLPYNLGSNVNTSEDEDAPFIDKNNDLYFSSKGHNTIGEYDIFKSEFNPETLNWNKAENLGMPINSTNDDIYFIKIDDLGSALFSSRREGGYGDADIYEMNFNETSQLIIHCKFTSLLDKLDLKDVQLSLYDVESGRLNGKYKPNKNYMSSILVVTEGKLYKLIIEGVNIEPIVSNILFTSSEKELKFELIKKNKE